MVEDKPRYIFPNLLANMMSKVDLRTQLEASMLSMCFMMIGLIITVIYFIIYFNFVWWYKVMLGLNGLAGVIFMSSNLITTYQQYLSCMEIVKFNKQTHEIERGYEN